MNDELEDTLRRTLHHAAEHAPWAPSHLSAHIETSSRRRTTRAQVVVAALAVTVVAGGIGVAVRGPGAGHVAPAMSSSPQPSAGLTTAPPERPDATPSPDASRETAEPIEKVWPEAVRRITDRLTNGSKFQPQLFMDDHTLLMTTWASFEKADAIYAYDLDGLQARKIADISTPKGVFASGFVVGGGRVIWQTIGSGGAGTQLWSVPIEGGKPKLIETDAPIMRRGDALAVAGDRLAFSVSEGGVFTVPLGGGAVTPVAGADRHHILRWPWVGTPSEYTPNGETSFEELLNVETGETSRAVVHQGEERVRCGVVRCAGARADGTYFQRLRDGSREGDLAGSVMGLAADRFYTTHRKDGGQLLRDLVTGKSGDLGIRPDAKGGSISVQPSIGDGRLVDYPLKGKYVIIDLTKIQ